MLYLQFYNSKNFSRQTNTKCSWEATITTHSNELFQKKKFPALNGQYAMSDKKYE